MGRLFSANVKYVWRETFFLFCVSMLWQLPTYPPFLKVNALLQSLVSNKLFFFYSGHSAHVHTIKVGGKTPLKYYIKLTTYNFNFYFVPHTKLCKLLFTDYFLHCTSQISFKFIPIQIYDIMLASNRHWFSCIL